MYLKRLLLLLFIEVMAIHRVSCQDQYWQQSLKYTIDVSLNDVEHTLDGSLSLNYKNNSPDTLSYIWFHIWANAFKNDKTAFSEQQLRLGKTAFYFSGQNDKGYINRLDFKSAGTSLETEDHPLYADIIKVILHAPLLPGETRQLATPFHIKLPKNFCGNGHNGTGGQSYQVTQWYPKPAVYDKDGWHPMPYLNQGGGYSEFASYDVRITLPKNYVVAATGELQDSSETEWLLTRRLAPVRKKVKQAKNKNSFLKPVIKLEEIKSDQYTKTLNYRQDGINDFVFFADKYLLVRSADIALPSGKTIKASTYYHEASASAWANSLDYVREVIHRRSDLLSEYPFNTISVVEADNGGEGGMAYPAITNISIGIKDEALRELIAQQVGYNWFPGTIANNQRENPWMHEGFNTYYHQRLDSASGLNRMFRYLRRQQIRSAEIRKVNQPMVTAAPDLVNGRYLLFASQKPADWLVSLEKEIGRAQFDTAIRSYVQKWRFAHPGVTELRSSLEASTGKDLSVFFDQLRRDSMNPGSLKKKIVPGFIFRSIPNDSIDYIDMLPVPAYNTSDGFMIGAAIHNYGYPFNRFQFFISPLYATRSKQFNGLADLRYSWFRRGTITQVSPGIGFSRFSTLSGSDSNGAKIHGGFIKFTPSLKINFSNSSPLSLTEKSLEYKLYLIGETGFDFKQKSSDGNYYPTKSDIRYRYINQLTFSIGDERVLYPYDASFQLQQAKDFYRLNLSADYFYNYAAGGGMKIRLFAAKFGYVGSSSLNKTFETLIYQPKLTAVRGSEDYTYSDPFIGRQESEGITSQQVMMRDGGLKLRTDIFQDLQGRSDKWVASLNFNTSIPHQVLPAVIPLKLFFDIGTYAGAWERESTGTRFLYVGGLQLSLFHNVLNIYAPLIYSKVFSDNLKTVPEENKFLRKISFSIDMHRFNRLLAHRQ